MTRRNAGFTLIELLIVVAIIGIIAAIAIPNLLNAIQRGKQKRTMADMRAIATAAEAYAVDNNVYPGAGYAAGGYTSFADEDVSVIGTDVSPTYIKQLPVRDGWATAFYYGITNSSQDYQVVSLGKDGAANTELSGKTTDFNADIVFENGSYVVWPEGIQQ